MPSIPTRVVCLWLLVAAGCTCRERALEPVPAFIRVTPAQLDFGRLVVGQVGSNTVEVINSGKALIEGTWSLRGEAFLSDDGNPSRAAVGSTVMAIRCAPSSVGIFDGELVISLAGFAPITVPLACEGVASPDCIASGPCRVSSWERSSSSSGEPIRKEPGGMRAKRIPMPLTISGTHGFTPPLTSSRTRSSIAERSQIFGEATLARRAPRYFSFKLISPAQFSGNACVRKSAICLR